MRSSKKISEDLQNRRFEYIKEFNFHPNSSVLESEGEKIKSIGIIVSAIENNFFSEAINGIESIAYSRGYNVIITQTHASYKREIDYLQYLSSSSIDGLLVSLSTETEHIQHFKSIHQKDLPIVFFGRTADEIKTHKVISDNFRGAYDATQHLIDSGYKQIAHLANASYLSLTVEKLKGYQKAMQDNGIKVPTSYIQYCPNNGSIEEEIDHAINTFLSLKIKPEAILTAGDKLTIGCLRLLKTRGLSVPKDIAMVGFSNFDFFDLFNPSLTIVKQPAFEMGRVATEMLLNLIENRRPVTKFEKKVLPTQLTIRDSSVRK